MRKPTGIVRALCIITGAMVLWTVWYWGISYIPDPALREIVGWLTFPFMLFMTVIIQGDGLAGHGGQFE